MMVAPTLPTTRLEPIWLHSNELKNPAFAGFLFFTFRISMFVKKINLRIISSSYLGFLFVLFYNLIMLIFIVGYLLLLIALQIFAKNFLAKNVKIFTLIPIVIIFSIAGYYAFSQYRLWQTIPLARNLLPPVAPIAYFLRYSLYHFFLSYLISLLFATVFYFLAKFLNKRKDERFFEREELNFAFIALFLSGFPGVLFVFIFIILAYLLVHLANLFIRKKIEVVPLYYLWFPSAILAIVLISIWFNQTNIWQSMRLV